MIVFVLFVFVFLSLHNGRNPFPPSSFFSFHILVSMLHVRSFPQMPGDLWSSAPISADWKL